MTPAPASFKPAAQLRRVPVTIGIIATAVAMFLMQWLSSGSGPASVFWARLTVSSGWPQADPWSVLTYWLLQPVGGFEALFLIFALFWLAQVGSRLEIEMGSSRFASLWLGLAIVGGVSLALGMNVIGASPQLFGFGIPLAAITMVWGVHHRDQMVSLFGVIPLKAIWLAVGFAALICIGVGTGAPLLALFAAVPFALGYWIGLGKVSYFRAGVAAVSGPTQEEKERLRQFNEEVARRKQERYEQDKLRALFERSEINDPEDESSGKDPR